MGIGGAIVAVDEIAAFAAMQPLELVEVAVRQKRPWPRANREPAFGAVMALVDPWKAVLQHCSLLPKNFDKLVVGIVVDEMKRMNILWHSEHQIVEAVVFDDLK